MLEILGMLVIILTVINLIDNGIEEEEEKERVKLKIQMEKNSTDQMLKEQQLEMRKDLLLLTRELGQEYTKDSKD
jgi:type VI protein secretion system component VasK